MTRQHVISITDLTHHLQVVLQRMGGVRPESTKAEFVQHTTPLQTQTEVGCLYLAVVYVVSFILCQNSELPLLAAEHHP